METKDIYLNLASYLDDKTVISMLSVNINLGILRLNAK